MKLLHLPRTLRGLSVSVFAVLVSACAGLLPKAPPPPAFYVLGGAPAPAPASAAAPATMPRALSERPTLIVNPPHAAAGFDSAHMLYMRKPHQLEAFTQSQWVDTPARMLAPMMVAALQRSPAWRAVLATPSASAGELRLDSEIVRLQQDFTVSPSRVRLTLRATLVDSATRRVLAWREFDESAVAPGEDAYGGVVAAHAALHALLVSLVAWSDDAAGRWQPPPPRP